MKKTIFVIALSLMSLSMAFAQQKVADQVFYACEVAAGDLANSGVTEKLYNIIFTSSDNSVWSNVLVNEEAFDENANQDDIFYLPFDQVQPSAITEASQVLQILIDPNNQDLVSTANIADLSAVKAIYVFQATNSQNTNLQLLTVIFLGETDVLSTVVAVGQDVAQCAVPAGA